MLTIEASTKSMNATAHSSASVSLPRVVDRKEGGLLVVAISASGKSLISR
jgi:siroheme synthase (precorrin-2 oxidase/ferrochelatase)